MIDYRKYETAGTEKYYLVAHKNDGTRILTPCSKKQYGEGKRHEENMILAARIALVGERQALARLKNASSATKRERQKIIRSMEKTIANYS